MQQLFLILSDKIIKFTQDGNDIEILVNRKVKKNYKDRRRKFVEGFACTWSNEKEDAHN